MLWEAAEFTDTVDDERERIARQQGRSNSTVLLVEAGSQGGRGRVRLNR
jgi:hypothetical protein